MRADDTIDKTPEGGAATVVRETLRGFYWG